MRFDLIERARSESAAAAGARGSAPQSRRTQFRDVAERPAPGLIEARRCSFRAGTLHQGSGLFSREGEERRDELSELFRLLEMC